MRYALLGYQAQKLDGDVLGTLIIKRKWYERWHRVVRREVEGIEKSNDLKHRVVVTLFQKL